MRKQVFGKKLKRDANERKALLKGLMEDLVLKEKIQTTVEKAQAIRGHVEKLVTKAKRKGADAKRLLQPYLSEKAYEKVINDLAKRFADRPGGYVRIVKLGARFGDNAKMAVIEWVDKTSAVVAKEVKKVEKKPVKPVIARKAKQSRSVTKKAEKKTKKSK